MIGKEITSFRTSRPVVVVERIERRTRVRSAPAFVFSLMLVVLSATLSAVMAMPLLSAQANGAIEVWWPQDGAHIAGTQPFKVLLKEAEVQDHEMFWQVDGGSWNWMDSNYTDYPHKEASVSVNGWNWKGQGPYKVNFIARRGGAVVAERSVQIYVDGGTPSQTTSQQTTAPAPQPVASPTPTSSAQAAAPAPQPVAVSAPVVSVSDSALYVDPNAPAVRQVQEWKSSRPTDAALMKVIADAPTSKWLGGWSNIDEDVKKFAAAAKSANKTAVFVVYNIPGRDCGGYSQGGTRADAYSSWVQSVANAVKGTQTIMILEPDALANITCLSEADQKNRLQLLSKAIDTLKSAGAKVYLDAGHSGWLAPDVAAERLKQAGVSKADGFALNVSNFQTTSASADYGAKVSSLTGGKHFVVDTSRNGRGSNGEWCNPADRGLGARPTTKTGNSLADAYLWIKMPGESDGSCNGAPGAGVWWPEYALMLAKNAQ